MDDDARSAARRRAWIAFGLAGALLVVNVVAVVAWRDDRRDRLDGARIEIERRLDERVGGDGPWGRHSDDATGERPDGRPGMGAGPEGGQGQRRQLPPDGMGRGAAPGGTDQGGTDQDGTDQSGGADEQGGTA
jgi:hypothetical protein